MNSPDSTLVLNLRALVAVAFSHWISASFESNFTGLSLSRLISSMSPVSLTCTHIFRGSFPLGFAELLGVTPALFDVSLIPSSANFLGLMARPDRLVLAESAAAELGVSVDSGSSGLAAGVVADADGVDTVAAGVLAAFFLGGAEGVSSAFLFLAPFVAVVVADVAGVVAAGVLDLLA